jgi:cation transporter-like permease
MQMVRKRAGWLVILFLSEMLTASAMGYFDKEIEKAVVLALFVPLVISSGGNSGSQAATLIIRAMALKELTLRDWLYVMRREIFSGLALGAILGVIGFIRIALWQKLHLFNYTEHWAKVALTIFLSLIGIVMWGTLSGSMIPFVLRRCGLDAAMKRKLIGGATLRLEALRVAGTARTAGLFANIGERKQRNKDKAAFSIEEAANLSIAETLRTLNTAPEGLTVDQAISRLVRYGANEIAHERPPHPIVQFFLAFKNAFVILLAALAVVSYLTGDLRATTVISLMVLASGALRFAQEYRSTQAADIKRA